MPPSSAPHIRDLADPLHWLADAAADRVAAGLHRELRVRQADARELDLAGNDYLGLCRHPDVVGAAVDALRGYGAGSTGSRLVSGTTDLHERLEAGLADFVGAPSALVFSSGYLANLGAVTALAGRGSLVVSDAGNHASLIDACRLSGARVAVVPSGAVDAVDRALAERGEDRAVVVTDSVFSASGRLAPVGALHEVVRRRGAVLLVDEAHALGVVGERGRGACAAAGLADEPDVVLTVTLSKALGGQGGAVLGSRVLRTHLIDTARPFIFDTALAPASAASAIAALGLVTGARVAALRRNVAALVELLTIDGALEVPASEAAIVPVVLGDPRRAVAARDVCAGHGVRVGCFRPPSVPPGGSCLRLAVRADLTDAQRHRAAAVIRAAVVGHPIASAAGS